MVNRLLAIVATVFFFLGVTPPSAASAHEQFCWMNVVTGEGACYATYAEVIADVSDGSTTLDSEQEGLTENQVRELAEGPSATYIISEIYDGAGYSGARFTFTAPRACDNTTTINFSRSVMPSGWNDRLSSFKSFSNCSTRIWEHGGFSGASYGFFVDSWYVGDAMNDHTSSIQWR